MPKIRRWFNVSHDINSDPEVWELTDRFGDRGLRAWLECLSIADRNDGFIPGELSSIEKGLSIKLNTFQVRTKLILSWFLERTWLIQDPDLRVRNYATYKPSREAKKEQTTSPPRLPSETPSPNQPKKNPKKDSFSAPPCQEAVDLAQLLSDKIFENNPQRTPPTEKQLLKWAKDAELIHNRDGHSWDDVRGVLNWCQADSFWKSNILSMGKLREKWNQLTVKMEKQSGQGTDRSEPKGIDALREWRRLKGVHNR